MAEQKSPAYKRACNTIATTLFVLVLFLCLIMCSPSQPIKIGVVGTLTGPKSDWGIASRNGIHFAVEEVNNAGGINGRKIELITKDVQLYKDSLNFIVDELQAEGAVCAIGPFFSSTAVKLVPYANKKKLLLFSPSASTGDLTGLDDLFFRSAMPKGKDMSLLASFLYTREGFKRIRVVIDESNKAYSEHFFKGVRESFEKLGGIMELVGTVADGEGHIAAAANLLQDSPDAVFVIAGGVDTAIIAQELRRAGSDIPLVGAGWAMTDDLIQTGGSSVEGLIMSAKYVDDPDSSTFQEYKKRYFLRYGKDPNYSSTLGYDAANGLLLGMSKSDNIAVSDIKESLRQIGAFPSPIGEYGIDNFGDAIRTVVIITIKDGKFVRRQ